MAFKKTISKVLFGKELIFDNAYLQINNVLGSKYYMELELSVFEAETKDHLLETRKYVFTPSVDDESPNFIKQGYVYLKELDEFKDAVDC